MQRAGSALTPDSSLALLPRQLRNFVLLMILSWVIFASVSLGREG